MSETEHASTRSLDRALIGELCRRRVVDCAQQDRALRTHEVATRSIVGEGEIARPEADEYYVGDY